MPLYHRHYAPGHSQFITTSVYRRAQLFLSDRLAGHFVDVLRELCAEMKFILIGWVLMPEHFHVLLRADPADITTLIVQQLKQQSAFRILSTLKNHAQYPWCGKMLARLRLPSTVHDPSHFRVWQRRFHPFNVYSQRKYFEKLNYTHNNPVKRGLVASWRLVPRLRDQVGDSIIVVIHPSLLWIDRLHASSENRRPRKACASPPIRGRTAPPLLD